MFKPSLVIPPESAPVELTEAKAHCRVDFDDDDTLITSLVQAATDHLDGYAGILGRCLVNQTWSIQVANWSDCIRLPFPDCSSVVVIHHDANGDEQTISSGLYSTLEDAVSAYVSFTSAFTSPSLENVDNPITITFVSGYGEVDAVPQAIKQAILLLVSHWYENRESVGANMSEVPMAVDMIIAPYRRMKL